MAFIGILCGAQEWDEVVEVCEASEALLGQYLGKEFVGVPSHDTFARFFSLVKVESLENAFRKTMQKVHGRLSDPAQPETIAVDGKYMKGVQDESALNVVTAYATRTGLCLGQEVADKKMNEPEQLRKLVEALNVQGCVITADALHCKKESVEKIREAEADYLLIVKTNQEKLYQGILEGVEMETIRGKARFIDHAEESTKGHGRGETRICHSCSHTGWLPSCGEGWKGIKSFGTITSERTILSTGETSVETRCFISSLEKDALRQLHIIQDHWKIENNLHWQLDVSFAEDLTKMKKNQLLGIALLKKLAMPVIKAFTYKKGASMKKKMLAAALKPPIKEQIIRQALSFYQIS